MFGNAVIGLGINDPVARAVPARDERDVPRAFAVFVIERQKLARFEFLAGEFVRVTADIMLVARVLFKQFLESAVCRKKRVAQFLEPA